MKKYLVLALLSLTTLFTQAQIVDPIQSSAQLKTGKTAEGEIVFNLQIEQGWHVYSVNLGSNGPIEASFHVNKMDGVEKVGGLVARGNEISKMDNLFGMKLRFFEHKAQFVQKVRFTKPNYTIDAYLEYGACNDQTCMPPQEVAFKKAGKSPAIVATTTPQEPTEKEAKDEDSPSSLSPDSMQTAATDTLLPAPVDTNQVAVSTDLWQPVIQELQQQD
ncbi:MAG: protein-disulfide reductase DsbD domain-containing protein, partial [Hoylesella buccalis]